MAEELYTNKVTLMDDFEALLAELRVNEQRIGLASSSSSGEGKPAPDIYLHMALLPDVEPMECIAIEDSTRGVQAATAADTYCIGFRGTGDEQQDLSAADTALKVPANSAGSSYRCLPDCHH